MIGFLCKSQSSVSFDAAQSALFWTCFRISCTNGSGILALGSRPSVIPSTMGLARWWY
nr:hypothetical protein [Halapricum sp. CBA1109]